MTPWYRARIEGLGIGLRAWGLGALGTPNSPRSLSFFEDTDNKDTNDRSQ